MKLLAFISLVIPALLLAQGSGNWDESFDPTSLSDWDAPKVMIESIKPLKEHLKYLDENGDSTETEEYLDFVFRVQLASTSDYDIALELEERANQTFAEDVIIQFDSPYYKIRVGKMANREDAQSLQQFAIQNGYRRAWVIRTENTPPKEN